jgi:hypothetical protein
MRGSYAKGGHVPAAHLRRFWERSSPNISRQCQFELTLWCKFMAASVACLFTSYADEQQQCVAPGQAGVFLVIPPALVGQGTPQGG